MNKMIRILTAPLKIISFTINIFITSINFIWNKFLSLFKFSLSFKISFFYLLTVGFSFLIITTSIIYSYNYYLSITIPKYISIDSEIITTYLVNNDSLNNNELQKYLTNNNKIEISTNNNLTLSNTPKKILDTSSKIFLSDFLNLADFNKPKTFNIKNYRITITPFMENYLITSTVLLMFLSIISILSLLLIFIMGNKINKRMFMPIFTMTNSAKKITGNNLNERIDISNSYDELKNLGETFNKMIDRIESSLQKQKRFVNDASHELRTPIAVIQGYSNMLSRWGKDDEKILNESVEAIKEESENMKSLVNSLLFLARSDSNKNILNKSSFLVNTLLNDLIKEYKLIDLNHKFVKEIEENLIIHADKKLIKQALRIFIQNSIKFTPNNGTISLNSFSKRNNIILQISDTGIGIAKKDLEHIFDRFYKSDQSRSKEFGGTGLGLSIAESIINSHNGQIKIQSKINIGTDIKIIIPYK
jgi:signal transduction histidine kinase